MSKHDFSKVIFEVTWHDRFRALTFENICQAGDRGGQGRAYLHLSDSHIRLKEFSTAIQVIIETVVVGVLFNVEQ